MFDGGFAVISGLAGGAAMVAALYMGIAMMPGQMKMNLLRLLGTMMLPDGTMAYMAGGMIHAGMSIVFGLLHVAIYAAFDLESNLAAWGTTFRRGPLDGRRHGPGDGTHDAPRYKERHYR